MLENHVKFFSFMGEKFNMVLEHLLKPECEFLCDILVSLKISQIEKFNKTVIKNLNERQKWKIKFKNLKKKIMIIN